MFFSKLARWALVIVIIIAAVRLSMVEAPPAHTSVAKTKSDPSQAVASKVRTALTEVLAGLPEADAVQSAMSVIEDIDGVKSVRVLAVEENLATLCGENGASLEKGSVYLAIPDVADSNGGIYGGFYADSVDSAVVVIVPSDLALQTDPRVKQLLEDVDGTRMECPAPTS